MAKKAGKFLKGIVGNHVLKEYRGKQLLIMKPHFNPAKVTEGTKNAAKTFGSASVTAYWIRVPLRHIITKFHDGTMNYRLNTAVLNCLNLSQDPVTRTFDFQPDSFNGLRGFEFNVTSLVKNNFLAQPAIHISGHQLQVTLPEMQVKKDIKFPKESSFCKFMIGTVMLDLTYGHVELCELQSLDIPNKKSVVMPPHTFNFEITPGCLCITAISLQYFETTFAGDFIINTKLFNPSAILHAYMAEGQVDPESTEKWTDMDFKITD